MPQSQAISAQVFCLNHNIDYHFIEELHQFGLIEIQQEPEAVFIPEEQLPTLEKMVRLHVDLDINIEGIETINNLLQRIETMQQEIMELRNRLSFYRQVS